MKKLLLCTAMAFASVSALAATEWNMATPYPDSDFHTVNVKQFIADVQAATGNEIKIILHSGASLYKAPEIFKAVRGGQVQLGELLVSSLGNDDALFQVDTLPFLATDYEQSKRLWAASKEVLSAKLDEKGAVLLYVTPWPGQNFYTKEPFDSIDYFKGKKLRAYNALTSQIAAELGAAPTTVEVPDIAQAFSTGQIDGMLTSSTTGVTSQSWDYVKNFTEVNAWYPKNMIFINKREWRKLDDATREKILAAAAKAEARGWELSAQNNAENMQTLGKNGFNMAQPSEAVKASFAKIGEKMAAEWVEKTGETGAKILKTYRGQ